MMAPTSHSSNRNCLPSGAWETVQLQQQGAATQAPSTRSSMSSSKRWLVSVVGLQQ
jgi:hypothetical protein